MGKTLTNVLHCDSAEIRFVGKIVIRGAENASTGKRKYGTAHFARMENACTENASTNLQGWKTQVGKCKYNANLQSDKKKFGTSQVSVVHFQVGWASGLQIGFF